MKNDFFKSSRSILVSQGRRFNVPELNQHYKQSRFYAPPPPPPSSPLLLLLYYYKQWYYFGSNTFSLVFPSSEFKFCYEWFFESLNNKGFETKEREKRRGERERGEGRGSHERSCKDSYVYDDTKCKFNIYILIIHLNNTINCIIFT